MAASGRISLGLGVLVALFLAATGLASSSIAQDYKRITNRWTQGQINVERGTPEAGRTQPGWWSADWIIEDAGRPFFRLRNRWTNQYLHVEHGPLETGDVEPGWWSAQWTLEPAEARFNRIRNRWTGVYLNVERGPLAAGPIEPGWWSAQWQIGGREPAGGGRAAPCEAGALPGSTAQRLGRKRPARASAGWGGAEAGGGGHERNEGVI